MDESIKQFESWLKKDFNPDNSGPYLKNMLLDAAANKLDSVLAARREDRRDAQDLLMDYMKKKAP